MKIQHCNEKPIRLTTVMGVVEFGDQGIAEVPREVGIYLSETHFGQPAGVKFCTILGDQGVGPQASDMTVAQLKAILAQRGIDVPANTKKADIVKLVEESNGTPTGGEATDAEKQGG